MIAPSTHNIIAAPSEPTALRIDDGVEKIPVPMIRPVMRKVVDHLWNYREGESVGVNASRSEGRSGDREKGKHTSLNVDLILCVPVRMLRLLSPSEY